MYENPQAWSSLNPSSKSSNSMDLQRDQGICILIKALRWLLCSWSKDPTLGNDAPRVDLVTLAGVTPETTRNLGWKGMEGIVYTWGCVWEQDVGVYTNHPLSTCYILASALDALHESMYVSSQVLCVIGLLYFSFQKETETWRGESLTFHSWEMVELRGELRWVGPKALSASARVS